MTGKEYIDYKKFIDTKVVREPFEYMVVPEFIKSRNIKNIIADFPKIVADGSFPLDTLDSGPSFNELIAELKACKLQELVEQKFSVDLHNCPIMITARGRCKSSNGKIHIDSKGKVITVLVYFNEEWTSDGGRLRMLRNEHDLEDYVAEVSPEAGTLVIFKCSDNAWHGHKSFDGVRRSIQLNWVVDESYLKKERFRHKISAWFKRFKNSLKGI